MEKFHCEEGRKKYCLYRELFSPEKIASMDISEMLAKESGIECKVLEDVGDGCGVDCIGKQLAARKYTERELVQLRCLGDHKHILGERRNVDPNPEDVVANWVEDRFAEMFAKVYAIKESRNEVRNHWPIYCEAEARVNGR